MAFRMVYVSLGLDAPGLLLRPRDRARHRESAVLFHPWHRTGADRVPQLVGGHSASTKEGTEPGVGR